MSRASAAPIERVTGASTSGSGAEKREASREELSALLDEARPVRYENLPVIGAELADIDEAHLWSFIREFEGDAFENGRDGGSYATGEVLARDLLLATTVSANGGGGSEAMPTVAGILLFGRDVRVTELLPRSSITAVRFAGDTVSGGSDRAHAADR